MYTCRLCKFSSKSLRVFSLHTELHRNVPNYYFPCGVPECKRTFRKYSAFKSHIYRDHKSTKDSCTAKFKDVHATLTCQILPCAVKCKNFLAFISHLKGHIQDGLEVHCPFKNCRKSFRIKSSFSSHISRKHKSWSPTMLSDSVLKLEGQDNSEQVTGPTNAIIPNTDDLITMDEEDQMNCTDIDQELFLKSIALFYLKLQAKFLLPVSTIQDIIVEFQKIHDIGQSHLFHRMKQNLVKHNLCDDDIHAIIDDLSKGDLLRKCNKGLLRSDQTRKTFFKTELDFVEPNEMYLGKDSFGRQRFSQYVPIKDTLIALFKHESVRKQYNMVHNRSTKMDVMEDVFDGDCFLTNELFQDHPSSLSLILYQDTFEIVNPLGSGKKKHKILAVYFTLADILPHNRSNIDHMQLVLLCREQDYKLFGQGVVFSRLIDDLCDLEENGIIVNDIVIRGTLFAITGDNLGSHNIGGFTENFSKSEYFCRYCQLDRNTIQRNPNLVVPVRSIETYKNAVENLSSETSGTGNTYGLKFDSVFNKLKFFHVCQPGLPPCLGHDLFEGVVSVDLALYIKHFVKTNKYFTYIQLNRIIVKFQFLASDANNKPSEINVNCEKLGGHAVQNWCFLRMLPLLIGNRLNDPMENQVWRLCLMLREIVELICAPRISRNKIAYLRLLIEEYLQSRKDAFPDIPLKPKHHYLAHYPQLILKFGPLIRLWTLRFESKHRYFKQCARQAQNFKNVCATLALKHQLLQAYLGAGYLFPPLFEIHSETEFHVHLYNEEIQNSLLTFKFEPVNTLVSHRITLKGTIYKTGMFVILGENETGYLFGRIVLILVHKGSEVYLVTQQCQSVHLVDLGVHCLITDDFESNDHLCVRVENLLDYYPLPMYNIFGHKLIPLHHATYE